MTYYLEEAPSTDSRSGARIFIGVIVLLTLLGLTFFTLMRSDEFLTLIMPGILGSFLGTYLIGGLIVKTLFPYKSTDHFIEVSEEKIVVRKGGVVRELPNRNLVRGNEDPEYSKSFTVSGSGGMLEIPFRVLPMKGKKQPFPKWMPLALVVKSGVLMVSGGFLRTRYFHFNNF